jgi:hypothetical protein
LPRSRAAPRSTTATDSPSSPARWHRWHPPSLPRPPKMGRRALACSMLAVVSSIRVRRRALATVVRRDARAIRRSPRG